MSRRSKTTTKAAAASATSTSEADASISRAINIDAPPEPKKARTSMSRVKGRRGAMSAFTNIPLDLLYDICSNLDPRDLFALSNTSKVFRSVVTGPSSAPLWVAARERVGLPELELPMTDLQHAHLLFGKGCAFCTRKNAGKAEVYFRARICTATMKDSFADKASTPGMAAINKAYGGSLSGHQLTLTVATGTSRKSYTFARYGPSYYLPEVAHLNAELKIKFPTEDSLNDRRLRIENGGAVTPFQTWWTEECESKHKARLRDGHKLRRWVEDQEDAKAMNKDEVRKARREEIERRFKLQGFHPFEFTGNFLAQILVRKPDLLTERTWPNVEATLRSVLLAGRISRRKQYLSSRITALKHKNDDSLPLAAYWPRSISLYTAMPAFKAACDVEGHVELESLWATHQDAILDELDALVRTRIEAMLRVLAAAHAQLRTARHEDKGEDVLTGMELSRMDVPRLPSFVPRRADQPLVATDAQLHAFLTDHPLSVFQCEACHQLCSGDWILRHVSGYDCLKSSYVDKPVSQWALCGEPEHSSMWIDGVTLARALYLRQLLDETDLVSPDDDLEQDAKELGVVWMNDEDRLRKVLKCQCGNFVGSSDPKYSLDAVSEAHEHLVELRYGPAGVVHRMTTVVEYTPNFLAEFGRAEIDVYDSEDDYYFGRHARPTLMYDSEDGMMMDSDGEPYGRRDVCCVM